MTIFFTLHLDYFHLAYFILFISDILLLTNPNKVNKVTVYHIVNNTLTHIIFFINNYRCYYVYFSAVKDDFLHLVRPVTDHVMPWTGYFTGIVIGSIWYWCADQVSSKHFLEGTTIYDIFCNFYDMRI